MKNRLDNELEELNNNIVNMGTLCENIITCAMNCFNANNKEELLIVNELENKIKEYENSIESKCLKLLLHQQPVAKDLRLISSTLKMITDLMRIGHQSYEISLLSNNSNILYDEIIILSKETIKLLSNSIDAYVKKDIDLAINTIKQDDIVDNLFINVRHVIIEKIKLDNNNAKIALDMFMIAKYLERIADHAVSLSELVIYLINGTLKGEIYDSNTRG